MASCNPFSLNFSELADDLFTKLQQTISEAGGNVVGDAAAGSFEVDTVIGDFRGTYVITGQQLTVDVEQRPFLVSCNRIEDTIRERIQNL